jgi:hypothetical protein
VCHATHGPKLATGARMGMGDGATVRGRRDTVIDDKVRIVVSNHLVVHVGTRAMVETLQPKEAPRERNIFNTHTHTHTSTQASPGQAGGHTAAKEAQTGPTLIVYVPPKHSSAILSSENSPTNLSLNSNHRGSQPSRGCRS